METQQETTTTPPAGETFRRGVSRALEALDKLTFLPPDVKETITSNAAKLCLAEAIAEQKALEVGKKALAEWEAQAPQIKAAAQRLVDEIFATAKNAAAKATKDASAEKAADSPQTPPSAETKPEA